MENHALQDIINLNHWRLPSSFKAIRLIYGLTQERIAFLLDVTRPTYSYYEAGKTEPSLSSLRRMALIYSIPVDTFFEFEFIRNCAIKFVKDGSCDPFQECHKHSGHLLNFDLLDSKEKELITNFRLLSEGAAKRIMRKTLAMRLGEEAPVNVRARAESL